MQPSPPLGHRWPPPHGFPLLFIVYTQLTYPPASRTQAINVLGPSRMQGHWVPPTSVLNWAPHDSPSAGLQWSPGCFPRGSPWPPHPPPYRSHLPNTEPGWIIPPLKILRWQHGCLLTWHFSSFIYIHKYYSQTTPCSSHGLHQTDS